MSKRKRSTRRFTPTDTHLVVLSAAANRPDGSILPVPDSVRGGDPHDICHTLLTQHLAQEVAPDPAVPLDPDKVFRDGEDGWRMLVISDIGWRLIEGEDIGLQPVHGGEDICAAGASLTGDEPKSQEEPAPSEAAQPSLAPQRDSKSALLLKLVQRPEGASLAELQQATGWQAHTVRAAISTHLRRKLGLRVEPLQRDDRGKAYQIVPDK